VGVRIPRRRTTVKDLHSRLQHADQRAAVRLVRRITVWLARLGPPGADGGVRRGLGPPPRWSLCLAAGLAAAWHGQRGLRSQGWPPSAVASSAPATRGRVERGRATRGRWCDSLGEGGAPPGPHLARVWRARQAAVWGDAAAHPGLCVAKGAGGRGPSRRGHASSVAGGDGASQVPGGHAVSRLAPVRRGGQLGAVGLVALPLGEAGPPARGPHAGAAERLQGVGRHGGLRWTLVLSKAGQGAVTQQRPKRAGRG
jgi:hypothetical protein